MIRSIKKHPIITLTIFAVIFSFVFIFSNRIDELFPFWLEIMTFFYDISIWIIAAWVFYLFQIYFPERKKKTLLKENFKKYWLQTKMSIISILLYESYPASLPEKLCDFRFFRKYFSEPHETEKMQTKWDWVLNHLSEDSIDLIAIEFEWLIKEVDFLFSKIELNDDEIFSFLKRLQSVLYRHRKVRLDYWEEKWLSRFLWDIFGSSNIITWERDFDIMDRMIEKI